MLHWINSVREISGGELSPQPEITTQAEICDNTIDDDADSLVDSNDPDCAPSSEAAITWGEQQNTEATNSNVCSPDDQSTNVCNPEEQAPAGEIPPIEATNSNVCSPDDQSTNV